MRAGVNKLRRLFGGLPLWAWPACKEVAPLIAQAHGDKRVVREIMLKSLNRLETATDAADKAHAARNNGARPQLIILDGPLWLQWFAYKTSSELCANSGSGVEEKR
jgi:hypothetical protein